MKQIISFFLVFQFFNFSIFQSYSQTGGNNTYEFLNLVTSARTAALGGKPISVKDGDLNLAFQNPSLLDTTMHNHLSLSYVNYFSDINYGSVIYSKSYKKYGSFSMGAHYIHYGTFQGADPSGQLLNEFTANDYALIIGWGKGIDSSFSVGANFKMIFSMLEQYVSFGTAVDLSATYHNKDKNITIAALIRNAGIQLASYRKKNREPLPFEIQLGLTHKLNHAPFQLSVTAQHLQKWDLTFKNSGESTPVIDPFTQEEIKQKKNIGDMIMRHFILGGEFLLSENFHLQLGYNYQRRKELQVVSRPALTGFSWGFGFRVYKFHVSYGRASYHLAGGPNHFSITTNLSEFYAKN